MSYYEDLRIVAIGMNPDASEMTFFLEGDNVICTKQFIALTKIMKAGGYTHLRGTAENGWTIMRSLDATLRQSEYDATLSQLKEM